MDKYAVADKDIKSDIRKIRKLRKYTIGKERTALNNLLEILEGWHALLRP